MFVTHGYKLKNTTFANLLKQTSKIWIELFENTDQYSINECVGDKYMQCINLLTCNHIV